MQIDDTLIAYLECLSYLTLSNDEKSRLKVELKEILGGMECLDDLNTEKVSECSHHFDNVNAFREDKVQASLERNLILQNAPRRNSEMFIAPKTVGEGL